MQYYNGDIQDVSNFSSSSFLQVNSCGIQSTSGTGGIAFRRKGRVDYHIVYVLEGTLEVTFQSQTHLLTAGYFVLYLPHESQKYMDFPGTRRAWIHFTGHAVPDILEEAQLSGGIYHTAQIASLEKGFIQLISEHNAASPVSTEKALLLSLLYQLGKATIQLPENSHRLEECAAYLVEHCNEDLSIHDLAAMSGLSQSRFMYLFRERFGMAPKEYQTNLRIGNAKTLLITTRLPISEIGAMSGYSDPLYFSRVFKKHTGQSPKQYRQQHL